MKAFMLSVIGQFITIIIVQNAYKEVCTFIYGINQWLVISWINVTFLIWLLLVFRYIGLVSHNHYT